MDQELESRWRRADAPFDGRVLYLDPGCVAVAALRSSLRLLSGMLQPVVGSEICIHTDWHDHDGFVRPSEPFSWDELDGWLQSEATLAAHRHGDFAVFWALHDLDYRFLLRFYLHDDEPVRECDLDLCAAEFVLQAAAARLADEGISTRLCSAKDYFDRAYGG